jgi:hypothetical protein
MGMQMGMRKNSAAASVANKGVEGLSLRQIRELCLLNGVNDLSHNGRECLCDLRKVV